MLVIVRLRVRRNGGSTIVGVVTRGVHGNGGVRGVDVLFVADRPRDPLKFLHVDQPDATAGLTSPDCSRNEYGDISENCEDLKSV